MKYRWIAYLIVSIIYNETLLRVSTIGVFLSPSLVFSAIFGTVISLILGGTLSLIYNLKLQKIIFGILSFIVGLLYASQVIYYKLMRTFYTLYSAGNAGEALEFAKVAIQSVIDNWMFAVAMFFPFIIFMVRKKNYAFVISKRQFASIVSLAIVLQIFGIGLIHLGGKNENSPYNSYYNSNYSQFSVMNLGLLTYMRVDAQRYVFGWQPKFDIEAKTDETVLDEVAKETFEIEVVESTTSETVEQGPTIFNAMDIDFDNLIINETDETLLEMHKYFSEVPPTSQNEYTGRFKDYNLIFITAEGLSHLAIRPDVTPTLYQMMHEGFYFPNFYTPLWGVSTTDGEYVATTGLIPKSGVWSYRQIRNNLMPFAMGNQLKQLGYITKAYHNHTYTYYDRNLTHPNMGYDYKGVGNGLVVKKVWPESDLEMMEVTIPEFIDEEYFHTYYMTVSGHMYYTFNDNAMSLKNRDVVKDLPYSENVKAYLAAQVEFDRAMGYLLSELEKSGKLDNTLIAISTDHYPYGLKQSELEELAGGKIDGNFELYHNAFILYAHSMSPEVVEKPASSLDILPTLSNLMGIEFDSRLIVGRDIFSDSPPLVILANKSFITDIGRYNSASDQFIKSEIALEVEDETIIKYRKMISNEINGKFYFSTKILEEDYYEKVLK